MSDLVDRLSRGRHPVSIVIRPHRDIGTFKERLKRGMVHIAFTETQGRTELGLLVDMNRSDFSKADIDAETGHITLVGDLTLDFVRVRCVATIELSSLDGDGYLDVLATEPTSTHLDSKAS